ncbi:tetratricopeptide repeat protein, partial [Patescibacteria group bacterium]|nr:tetratricopeptide repeat protein [Patescibacteria group bacterium]
TLGGCAGKTLHYRPMNSLSFLLTYQISSQPWFFHLVSLLYFFGIVSLLFIFVKLITKNVLLAFFSSIIFLIHPINNEVVNWISAVPDLMLVLFTLLSLIFYTQYRTGKRQRTSKNLIWALGFYFLAVLSKEIAVFIIPVLVVSLDLLIFQFPLKKLLVRKEIKKYLLFGVPFLIYFGMRMMVLGGFGGLASKGDYLGNFSFVERINAFFNLFTYSLKEIFYPYPLLFFHEVSIGKDLLNTQLLISLSIFVLFFSLLYLAIKQKKGIVALSLIWFFIFFSPILIFFNIAGERNHFFERYLFGSSLGFAILIASLLAYLWQSKELQRVTQRQRKGFVALLIVLVFGVSWYVIFPRNTVWVDNITLLEATLEQKPHAVSIRDFLAYEYLTTREDAETARIEYEKIVEQDPNYSGISHVYNHLGNYYRETEEVEKAEEYYIKSIAAAEGTNYRSYNNLGALYTEQGKQLQALTNFCKALQIDPSAPEPQQNYNRIASLIQSVEDAQFVFLYQDVMFGGNFVQSSEDTVQFKRKFCSYGNCFYTFSFQTKGDEILFPFLIMVSAFPQEIIRIQQAEFNSAAGEITVAIDEQFKDRLLTFNFPACSGTRYESQISPQ